MKITKISFLLIGLAAALLLVLAIFSLGLLGKARAHYTATFHGCGISSFSISPTRLNSGDTLTLTSVLRQCPRRDEEAPGIYDFSPGVAAADAGNSCTLTADHTVTCIHRYTITALSGSYSVTLNLAGEMVDERQTRSFDVFTNAPPSVSISASLRSIYVSRTSTIAWSSLDASACTASGDWSGNLLPNGSRVVSPTTNGIKLYRIMCVGPLNPPANNVAVVVVSNSVERVINCQFSRTCGVPCGYVGVTSTINCALGEGASCGAFSEYCGSCGRLREDPQCEPYGPPPTASISANPQSIPLGQSTTLSWSSTDALACGAFGDWSDVISTSGSQPVTPTTTGMKRYNIVCVNAVRQATSSVTVTVTQPMLTATCSVSRSVVQQGDPATFSANPAGGTSPYRYQWQYPAGLSTCPTAAGGDPSFQTCTTAPLTRDLSAGDFKVNVYDGASRSTGFVSCPPVTVSGGIISSSFSTSSKVMRTATTTAPGQPATIRFNTRNIGTRDSRIRWRCRQGSLPPGVIVNLDQCVGPGSPTQLRGGAPDF